MPTVTPKNSRCSIARLSCRSLVTIGSMSCLRCRQPIPVCGCRARSSATTSAAPRSTLAPVLRTDAMVRVLTALVLSMLIATAYSATWVNAPYWVIALTCSHHDECFAASNGSYTPHLNAARHFDDPAKAEEFVGTLTSSLRGKSPQIQ